MTMFKPNIQLRKLRILNGPLVVYSADFHEGVNIISGQNASGKSTVVDFIFYALGGDNVPWKNEALLCTDVSAELSLNGSAITVRRMVNEKSRNPLSIFWGRLEQAQEAPYSEWEVYPYQRSASKESFSQVLFRVMGLPELKGEGASNITMHQILRLMYVDQRTPHDEIFRGESFDTILIRETIGNYLCGIYSDRLYDAQMELKSVEAKLDKSVSDLRNIFSILGRTGQGGVSTSEFLRAESDSIESELLGLHKRLVLLRQSSRSNSTSRDSAVFEINKLRDILSELQREYSVASDRLADLEYENKDSGAFIAELERRLAALDDSQETRQYLGAVHFNFCPCCLSKVQEILDPSVCPLCKSEGRQSMADSQVLRMRNELALQRRESIKLFEAREAALVELRRRIPELRQEIRQIELRYRTVAAEWVSPVEHEIDEVNLKIGELNQKRSQIAEYQKLASVIEGLQAERAQLEKRRAELSDIILTIQSGDEDAKARIEKAIFDELIYLLRNDIPRQDEFINASAVGWSFGQNRVSVNGQTQFSESSMVVLKHCFHLSLLAASAKIDAFRYPRFVLLDGIEDGGQETERSHSLQRLIVSVSESLPSSHQIIFATSQIAPDLATNSLVVGKASSVDEKTLALPH